MKLFLYYVKSVYYINLFSDNTLWCSAAFSLSPLLALTVDCSPQQNHTPMPSPHQHSHSSSSHHHEPNFHNQSASASFHRPHQQRVNQSASSLKSRTTPAAGMARSSTLSSEHLLLQSLKTENEILRSELNSTTKYSSQLRQQLKQQQNSSQEKENMKQLVQKLETQLNHTHDQLERLHHENSQLKTQHKELSYSLKHGAQQLESRQNNQLLNAVSYCVRVMRAFLEEMQRFHRLWLPTYHSGLEKELLRDGNNERFRVASSVEIERLPVRDDEHHTTNHEYTSKQNDGTSSSYMNNNTAHYHNRLGTYHTSSDIEAETLRDISDLYDMLERLDRSIFMMKLLADAKIESVTLVHKELKHQNTELQSQLSTESRSNQKLKSLQEKNLEEFQQKKAALRNQMQQLQKLYERQKQDLQNKLKQAQSNLNRQQNDYNKLDSRYKELEKKYNRLDNDKTYIEEKLIDQENARVKLAEELDREKQVHEITKQELSNLKIAQKFLNTTSENNQGEDAQDLLSKIPKEKLDLMQTINRLMEDNQKLKDENVNLSVRVKKYEKQEKLSAAAKKAASKRGSTQNGGSHSDNMQEVQLIANDKLSDSQLTHKILARKLQQERSYGRPMEARDA